eukprot:g53191.t1
MREHKIAHTYLDAKDNKRKQLLKPAVIKAVWEHFQICSCNLEDSGAAGDAANRGRGERKGGPRGRKSAAQGTAANRRRGGRRGSASQNRGRSK